jgi:hypothetical protein
MAEKAPFHSAFENAPFHSAYSPKMHNSTSSLNTLYTAESAQFYSAFSPTTISLTPCFCWNAKFDSAFSPKTLKTIPKRTVTNTALNLTPRSQRQRSAMLRAFGENAEWSKTLNICANLKNIFENVPNVDESVWGSYHCSWLALGSGMRTI